MQIDAVHDEVGIFEACTERRPGGNPRQFFAVERVQHQESGGRIGDGQHRIAEAETIEDVKHVRPKLDAIADGAEFRRAFKDSAYSVRGAPTRAPS